MKILIPFEAYRANAKVEYSPADIKEHSKQQQLQMKNGVYMHITIFASKYTLNITAVNQAKDVISGFAVLNVLQFSAIYCRSANHPTGACQNGRCKQAMHTHQSINYWVTQPQCLAEVPNTSSKLLSGDCQAQAQA